MGNPTGRRFLRDTGILGRDWERRDIPLGMPLPAQCAPGNSFPPCWCRAGKAGFKGKSLLEKRGNRGRRPPGKGMDFPCFPAVFPAVCRWVGGGRGAGIWEARGGVGGGFPHGMSSWNSRENPLLPSGAIQAAGTAGKGENPWI